MKVNMDGLRRSLGRAYNDTARAYVTNDRDALVDGLAELRSMVGALMCIYSKDPDDVMSDMTDEADKLLMVSP